MTLHPLDEGVALEPISEPTANGSVRFQGKTHPLWANMVGPFGGITAATMLNAARVHPQCLGEPLVLTVNYAGALTDGGFEIEARPARTTRTTQHWIIELHQGGAVAATATAVFATRRDTWSAQESTMLPVPAATDVAPFPAPPRIAWPGRYEMRFVAGPWPDLIVNAELPDSTTTMWIRDEPPRPLDALALASICDAFYPRVFRRRQRFTPAGTVSITTMFHASAAAFSAQGDRPVLATARGQRFVSGFFDQAAEVWSDDGQLLATSQQVVYFKE